MSEYQQGRLLLTQNTRRWTQSQRDEANAQECCMVFKSFSAEDEGRSRMFVCKCASPTKAAELVKQLNELTALRSQVAELQQDNGLLKIAHEQCKERLRQCEQANIELQRQLDEAAGQAVWQPLTGPGQIREGMKLRFVLSGKTIAATAKLILRAGTNREEVVYNRAKNHYFITSMAIDGTSAHKSVEFLAGINLPAIIEQAKAEEREACAKVCDDYSEDYGAGMFDKSASDCADAIRARKP